MDNSEYAELSPADLFSLADSDTYRFRWSSSRSEVFRMARDKYMQEGETELAEQCQREIFSVDLSTHESPRTRFSPLMTGTTTDGQDVSYPNLQKDFPEVSMEYYKARSSSTGNPILKARYSDAIWEFAKDIQFARSAVDAYLDCCPIYFENGWDDELGDALDRSLALACMMADESLQEKVIAHHVGYIERLQGADRQRYLYEIIDSLLRHHQIARFLDFGLLNGVIETAIYHYKENEPDSFHLRRSFMGLLLRISKIQKDESSSKTISVRIAESYVEEAEWKQENYASGNMVAASFYEKAMRAYMDLGTFPDKVEELKVKIVGANRKAAETEYRVLSAEIKIPTEKIDKHLSMYKGKTPQEIFEMMFSDPTLIPSFEKAKESAVEQSKKAVLLHMVPVSIMKGDIRVRTISGEEQKLEYEAINTFQMVYQACENLLLEPIFQQGEGDNPGLIEALADYLSTSEIMSNDRMPLIRHALSRLQDRDYISGIHILVFQIEGILRDLVAVIGAPTFSYRNGEMREINLTSILGILNQVQGMNTDTLRFIDVFLNDIRGDNYRNEIGHALVKIDDFSPGNARLLMLILTKIAPYRVKTMKPPAAEDSAGST